MLDEQNITWIDKMWEEGGRNKGCHKEMLH